MENISRAFIITFSMIMFVFGLAYSMYLINKVMSTSEVLLDNISVTNYYDNIKVGQGGANSNRQVRVDTIASTLYRYVKEQYSVKIYNINGSLLQLFDISVEGQVKRGEPDFKETPYAKKLSGQENLYMFGAPWQGDTENAKTRVSYFLNGEKGYINDVEIDYSNLFGNDSSFLEEFKDTIFTEEFIEYVYDGETISTPNGVETITGSEQESSKIIIIYRPVVPE